MKIRKRRRKKRTSDSGYTTNIGTMKGRSAEVVETVDRQRLGIGFLQETQWKGMHCHAVSFPVLHRTAKVCGYAPQQSRPEAEKPQFFDNAHSISTKIPPSKVLVAGGDVSGYLGRSADGHARYEEIHWWRWLRLW